MFCTVLYINYVLEKNCSDCILQIAPFSGFSIFANGIAQSWVCPYTIYGTCILLTQQLASHHFYFLFKTNLSSLIGILRICELIVFNFIFSLFLMTKYLSKLYFFTKRRYIPIIWKTQIKNNWPYNMFVWPVLVNGL